MTRTNFYDHFAKLLGFEGKPVVGFKVEWNGAEDIPTVELTYNLPFSADESPEPAKEEPKCKVGDLVIVTNPAFEHTFAKYFEVTKIHEILNVCECISVVSTGKKVEIVPSSFFMDDLSVVIRA